MAITKDFAKYILHSRVAKDLMAWLEDTLCPDEMFLPTLNHNVHLNVPGGYRGKHVLIINISYFKMAALKESRC